MPDLIFYLFLFLLGIAASFIFAAGIPRCLQREREPQKEDIRLSSVEALVPFATGYPAASCGEGFIFRGRKSRAFTLIELLVVVSIIGVLSSIIVVSTSAIRTKARNNAIKTNLNSLRQAGELWYSSYESYTGFCSDDNCSEGSSDWQRICAAVKVQNGNKLVTCKLNASNSAWCTSTELVGGSNYCVDSRAYAGSPASCDETDATCVSGGYGYGF